MTSTDTIFWQDGGTYYQQTNLVIADHHGFGFDSERVTVQEVRTRDEGDHRFPIANDFVGEPATAEVFTNLHRHATIWTGGPADVDISEWDGKPLYTLEAIQRQAAEAAANPIPIPIPLPF